MINRYRYRKVLQNDNDLYSEAFRNRNVKFINQYATPEFKYLSSYEEAGVEVTKHVWKEGDRLYKLAEEYYGDSKDWWVIARFNLKPTESHFEVGDIIDIPTPLENALRYMAG